MRNGDQRDSPLENGLQDSKSTHARRKEKKELDGFWAALAILIPKRLDMVTLMYRKIENAVVAPIYVFALSFKVMGQNMLQSRNCAKSSRVGERRMKELLETQQEKSTGVGIDRTH